MSDNAINDNGREFKVWMVPMARGMTHAELYRLIAAGYDYYGAIPLAREVTTKERLDPNIPAGARIVIEPVLVFVGPADAPDIVLQAPDPGIVQ